MPDHIPTRAEENARHLEIETIRAAMNDYQATPRPTSDYITWVTMLLARLDEAERLLRQWIDPTPGPIEAGDRPSIFDEIREFLAEQRTNG